MAATILLRIGSGYENAGWSWLIPARVYFTARLEDDTTHAPITDATGVRFYLEFDPQDGRAPLFVDAAPSAAPGEWLGAIDLVRGAFLRVQAVSIIPALSTTLRVLSLRVGAPPSKTPREAIVLGTGQILTTDQQQYLSGQRITELPAAGPIASPDMVPIMQTGPDGKPLLANAPVSSIVQLSDDSAAAALAARGEAEAAALSAGQDKVTAAAAAAAAEASRVLSEQSSGLSTVAAGQASTAADIAAAASSTLAATVDNAAVPIATYALMLAQAAPAVNKRFTVYADPDPALNGNTYLWTGSAYTLYAASAAFLAQRIGSEVGANVSIERDSAGKTIRRMASNGQRSVTGMAGLADERPAEMLHPLGYGGRQAFRGIEVPFSAGGTWTPYALPDDLDRYLLIMPTMGMSIAGGANDNPNDVVITQTALYPNNAFMPSTGRYCIGQAFDSLVPLKETASGVIRESSSSGMVYQFLELCQEKLGAMPVVATFCASRGGRSWGRHKPGNEAMEFWETAMRGTVLGAERMARIPLVISFMHFGLIADRTTPRMSKAASISSIRNMERTISNSVRLHTGQTSRFPQYVFQPFNAAPLDGFVPGYAQAPLDMDGQGDIRCGSSKIWFNPSNQGNNTGVHMDSASYLASGREDGRDIFEEVCGPGYSVFKIVQHRWISNKVVDLYYNPNDCEITLDFTGAVVTPPTWPGSIGGVQFFDYGTTISPNGQTLPAATSQTVAALSVEPDPDTPGRPKIILRTTFTGRPTGPSPRIHIGTRNDGVLDPTNPDEDQLLNNSGRSTGARNCIRTTSTPTKWAPIQVYELTQPPL